ncbi:hypothetical protein ALP69_100763 [Pseudomonas syringae pv. aceris]|nr:hypothetical protein ALP69_100763 [Pseudomonas syringae pv. aceris]
MKTGAQRVRVILEKQAHRRIAVFCKGLFRARSPVVWRREAYLREEGALSQLKVLPVRPTGYTGAVTDRLHASAGRRSRPVNGHSSSRRFSGRPSASVSSGASSASGYSTNALACMW